MDDNARIVAVIADAGEGAFAEHARLGRGKPGCAGPVGIEIIRAFCHKRDDRAAARSASNRARLWRNSE
jgi:hypothetical protein